MYNIIIYLCRYNSTEYYFIQTILLKAPQFVALALNGNYVLQNAKNNAFFLKCTVLFISKPQFMTHLVNYQAQLIQIL